MSESASDVVADLPDGSLVVASRREERWARGAETGTDHKTDMRTPTEQDRDRLAYSPYIRRLAGVTQVVSPELTTSRFHSRASHTYKVALLAKEIAEHLVRTARGESGEEFLAVIRRAGGLDVAACEAAGLAHDLGHPPFGHAGERMLNERLTSAGVTEGFEGNAQSLRIVTKLETHKQGSGLNLTNVTLGAILKYPWFRDKTSKEDPPKFGAYESERAELVRARAAAFPDEIYPEDDGQEHDNQPRHRQTLEASVMDLADDIAYSIHDLEDFWPEGIMDSRIIENDLEDAAKVLKEGKELPSPHPLAEHMQKLKEYPGEQFNLEQYRAALDAVTNFSRRQPRGSVVGQASRELVRDGLNSFVGDFFGAIRMDDSGDKPSVTLDGPQWHVMQVLKHVTKHYFVSRSRMGTPQRSQQMVIASLFDSLELWLGSAPEMKSLPHPLQDTIGRAMATLPTKRVDGKLDHRMYRAIADYICGMSDSEALQRASWLRGETVPGITHLGVVS